MSQSLFILLTDNTESHWHIRFGILQNGVSAPHCEGLPNNSVPTLLLRNDHFDDIPRSLWVFEAILPLGYQDSYQINGISYHLNLPASLSDLKIGFVSCDGTEHPETLDGYDPDAMWGKLYADHQHRPYHLLLHGGDQIYADGLEDQHPDLAKGFLTGTDMTLSADAKLAVERHFWHRYCHMLERAAYQDLSSQIPSIMMWDDHDVYDGFGSHIDGLETTPFMQKIRQIATQYFYAFQRLSPPQESASLSFSLGELALIIPDLRSHRTNHQVMAESDFTWLDQTLSNFAQTQTLLMVSSVPLFGVEIGFLERFLQFCHIRTRYDDDLRDQFCSPTHQKTRQRIFTLLDRFAAKHSATCLIFSGEIHMAGYAQAHLPSGHKLHQMISSGITHPPPPSGYAWFVGWLTRLATGLFNKSPLNICLRPIQGRTPAFQTDRNFLSFHFKQSKLPNICWHFEKSGPVPLSETEFD